MDLFSELQAAVLSDLTIDSGSSLFPTATVKLALNRAYSKVGGLYRWPELRDAKKTSTENGKEYYDFPTGWRSDSIWRLEVDSVQYGEDPDGSPMSYEDYLQWRADDDNSSSTSKKWGVQARRFFIYPVPTTDGAYNISVWGFRVVETLTDADDLTIFSYSMPECNEAIVLEAVAILKSKGEDRKTGELLSAEAKQILTTAWSKVRMEMAKYEKVQPFFHVDDMFSGKSTTEDIIGNF
jgi:hypothetical protein